MAPELRQFIQEEHAVVRQRHLARHRDLAAIDQAYIGDRVMRGATAPVGDRGRAPRRSGR
jgi:hypothetical protein